MRPSAPRASRRCGSSTVSPTSMSRTARATSSRAPPPWAPVTPEATAECLRSFDASLLDATDAPPRADHDRRLELLSRRLAAATSEAELDACLPPLAEELHADQIRLAQRRPEGEHDPIAGRRPRRQPARGAAAARTRVLVTPRAADHPRRQDARAPRSLLPRRTPVEPVRDRPRADHHAPARAPAATHDGRHRRAGDGSGAPRILDRALVMPRHRRPCLPACLPAAAVRSRAASRGAAASGG